MRKSDNPGNSRDDTACHSQTSNGKAEEKKFCRKRETRGTRAKELRYAVDIARELLQQSPDGRIDQADLYLFCCSRYRRSLSRQAITEYHRLNPDVSKIGKNEYGLLTLERVPGRAGIL